MADKTQINLERIRACDAEWEESKHPRSENGQFTSGGGVKVSKIQSGGKAKLRTEEGAKSDANERYWAKEDRIHREKNKIDNEKEAAHKKYRNARHRLYNLAIKANRAGQKSKAEKYDDLAEKVEGRREEVLASYDPKIEGLVKKHQNAKEARKRELQNITKTFNAAKKTLEKARPKIAAMRELAKAAQPAPKPQPKAAKNNGGLESYKYKPPSKLEGFPIVMASKKTNSGLGGGNRFKFGFKKYKDGIMIRYVDDYWDSSDYAFVPLKNPTLENAYSYSDNASSKTVSALKDSLVTNEELGKIARQLK